MIEFVHCAQNNCLSLLVKRVGRVLNRSIPLCTCQGQLTLWWAHQTIISSYSIPALTFKVQSGEQLF